MINNIIAFLQSLPNELYVFIISILPLIELRGAVPVGAALGLPFFLNYPISVIGNLLPVPFILLFIPKILDFLARFKIFRPIVQWLHKKADKNREKIIKKSEKKANNKDITEQIPKTEENATDGNIQGEFKADTTEESGSEQAEDGKSSKLPMSKGIFIGLLLFVAIPFPGTGAWTGALVSALFDLPKRYSFLAIALGVLLCGVIMCLASYGVLGFLSFLL